MMRKPVLFLLLSLLMPACATLPAESARTYNLGILVPGPMGIPVNVASIQIRNPQRHTDGSLCFERVDNGLRGCLKLFQYDLAEAERQ